MSSLSNVKIAPLGGMFRKTVLIGAIWSEYERYIGINGGLGTGYSFLRWSVECDVIYRVVKGLIKLVHETQYASALQGHKFQNSFKVLKAKTEWTSRERLFKELYSRPL